MMYVPPRAGTLHHNYQQPKLSGTGLRGFLRERSCLIFLSVFAEQFVRVWGSKRVRGVFVGGQAGKAGRMVGLAERVGCVLGDGQRAIVGTGRVWIAAGRSSHGGS